MSNYIPVTNFLSKDSLATGNPLKLVKGADLTTEFAAVQTALNSKADGTTQFFPAGTVSQPSVGFQGTAGIGMFNNGGVLSFATNATLAMSISAAGNVVVAAPSSGVGLTVTGVSGASQYACTIQGGTSGGDRGMRVNGGTGATDYCEVWANAAATTNLMLLYGDGGLQVGPTVTGGDLGSGTINAAVGFYVQGYGVFPGVPCSTAATSSPTAASDSNTCIYTTTAAITLTITGGGTTHPVGTQIQFVNNSSGNVSIAITTDTMFLGGSGTTGTRTLAKFGQATAHHVASGVWFIDGVGLS